MQKEQFFVEPSQKNLKDMHEASTLVIGCVDFRLRDELERFLRNELSLIDNYDEVTLPGASLAFVEKQYPAWGQSIEQITGLLQKLHKIKRVIFVDHLGCGAYKLLKGKESVDTEEKEKAVHMDVLREATQKMKELFPDLEVYSFIMSLDGHIAQVK